MISFSGRQTRRGRGALSGMDVDAAGELSAAQAAEAAQRLNRLLAEFRLYGGFGGGPDGMRLWGEVQRTVREIDRLRDSPQP
jgi:hypothetical protein